MKIKNILIAAFLTLSLTSLPTKQSHAIIWEVVKAAIVAVINAMDLAVQRLQNATIKLQNAQKAIENAMAKLKLKEISEWGEKQRNLFKTYYDELQKVKSIIAYYKRVKDISQKQAQLIKEYKAAYNLITKDKHFTSREIIYISQVYTGILEESAKNVEQLLLVVSSFTTQMSDSKRLELIQHASNKIEQNLSHLRQLTQQSIMLSIERSKDEQEQRSIMSYYGIE